VKKEYRGKGIGEALMNAVVENARIEGRDRVELDVEGDNESAIAFYKKKGFEVKEWYAAKLYLNEKIKSNE
jgi:ribosomal protein S18 acetylase RimI-like enzyme